jgi:hypothetical protein
LIDSKPLLLGNVDRRCRYRLLLQIQKFKSKWASNRISTTLPRTETTALMFEGPVLSPMRQLLGFPVAPDQGVG